MRKNDKKKKILIVSASAGHGHVIAANALAAALRETPEAPEVMVEDILKYATAFYRGIIRDAYLFLAKRNPHLFGYIYHTTNRELDAGKPRDDHFLQFMEGVNTRAFRRFLLHHEFDHIVSTHYLPPQIMHRMKVKNKLPCPVTTVTTDYGLHAYWMSPGTDYYVVADEINARHLYSAGIEPERVLPYGIPVRPAFSQDKDKTELRKKYGFPPDEKLLLVLSGGFGVGPVQEVLAEMDRADVPFHMLVSTGHNTKLFNALSAAADDMQHPLHVMSYTEDMDEYMRMADLLVSKPGGLTVAESMSAGLPILIINPIPGQENLNSDMLLEEGAAVKAFGRKQLGFKLESVLGNTEKFTWLQQNAARLGKPDAVYKLAEFVIKHTKKDP